MKKTAPRTKSFTAYLKENERDPAYRAALDRARLRVEIARAIKAARERAGLTQEELAEELELPQSVVGRLESLKDKRLPSVDLLARIARATNQSLAVDYGPVRVKVLAS
jgi:ribosome-binding protein aMBF1 (putative translation factor)